MRKLWQGEYSRTSFFWKKSLATRLMPISRMYRFWNWQNALTCLSQERYAPREDTGNLRSVEIAQVNYRITEASDWFIAYSSGKVQKNEPLRAEISFHRGIINKKNSSQSLWQQFQALTAEKG